jgi:hypothetical protein
VERLREEVIAQGLDGVCRFPAEIGRKLKRQIRNYLQRQFLRFYGDFLWKSLIPVE